MELFLRRSAVWSLSFRPVQMTTQTLVLRRVSCWQLGDKQEAPSAEGARMLEHGAPICVKDTEDVPPILVVVLRMTKLVFVPNYCFGDRPPPKNCLSGEIQSINKRVLRIHGICTAGLRTKLRQNRAALRTWTRQPKDRWFDATTQPDEI